MKQADWEFIAFTALCAVVSSPIVIYVARAWWHAIHWALSVHI